MDISLGIHKSVKKTIGFYRRFEKYAPIASFIGGFTWDSVTLTRIDRMSDNIILLIYLIGLGLFITLYNYLENNLITKPVILKYQQWVPLAIQFLMGGLLSSYVVFYIQSASFSQTWIFISLLALLLVANEFLDRRVSNLYFLFSLYFFTTYSFFIFFIPVLIKVMSTFVFLLSGFLSLTAIFGMLYFFHKKSLFKTKKQFKQLSGIITALYVIILVFYWLNMIPPVPLSLKNGGMYHHVHRGEEGYHLKYVKPSWYQFWKKTDNPFYHQEGDTAFCFTAIFAPTELKKEVFHFWQWYNPEKEEWVVTDRLGFNITGGRDGGYRGYTFKRHIKPGKWRIDVRTEEGLVLGRISFVILFNAKKEIRWKEKIY